MSDATLIKAAKLWRKRSERTGKDYFVGRMGGCRVLVMENDRNDGTDTDEPTHYLLLGHAEDRRSDGGKGREGRR